MTAPRRAGGADANTRGIIVLVVAVIVGIVLLAKVGGSPSKVSAGSVATTAPASTAPLVTTPDSTPSTTPTTSATGPHDRTALKVLVLNANGGKNQATNASTKLKGLGFSAAEPGPDPAPAPKSAVYYQTDYQADATAAAAALGLDPSVVAPLPKTFPSATVVASRGAKVVVVLGKDAPTF